mmetsp:Transcript_6601/g.7903  ORF Transcript_6601/g.7903 Transcript_6601/m.7903 type:complete len:80 (-) Transcript_6601:641-880(-)
MSLTLRIHKMMIQHCRDKKLIAKFNESRAGAERDYAMVRKIIDRMQKVVNKLIKDQGLSLDLNKINYVAKLHETFLDRL